MKNPIKIIMRVGSLLLIGMVLLIGGSAKAKTIAEIEEQITAFDAELLEYSDKLSDLSAKKEQLLSERDRLSVLERQMKEDLKGQYQSYQVSSKGIGVIESLLSGETLGDLLQRIVSVNKVVTTTRDKIDASRRVAKDAEEKVEKLEKELKKEESIKNEIEAKKQNLEKELTELKASEQALQLSKRLEETARNADTVLEMGTQSYYPGQEREAFEAITKELGVEGVEKEEWAYIIEHESGWNSLIMNPIGAYGLPQAYPGDKMVSAGADWRTNPYTQLKWMYSYVKGKYGSFVAVNWRVTKNY